MAFVLRRQARLPAELHRSERLRALHFGERRECTEVLGVRRGLGTGGGCGRAAEPLSRDLRLPHLGRARPLQARRRYPGQTLALRQGYAERNQSISRIRGVGSFWRVINYTAQIAGNLDDYLKCELKICGNGSVNLCFE